MIVTTGSDDMGYDITKMKLNDILKRNSNVESFNISDYLSSLNSHLEEIDQTIQFNQPVNHLKRTGRSKDNDKWALVRSGRDNRLFFREIIGTPAIEYTN